MEKVGAIFVVWGAEARGAEASLQETLPVVTEWRDFLWFIITFSHETNIAILFGHIRQHTARNGPCPKHSQGHLSEYKTFKRWNAWQNKGILRKDSFTWNENTVAKSSYHQKEKQLS